MKLDLNMIKNCKILILFYYLAIKKLKLQKTNKMNNNLQKQLSKMNKLSRVSNKMQKKQMNKLIKLSVIINNYYKEKLKSGYNVINN